MMFVGWISLLLFLKIGFISDVYSEDVRKNTELSLETLNQSQEPDPASSSDEEQDSMNSIEEEQEIKRLIQKDEKQEKDSMIPIKDEQEIQHFIQEIERYMKGLHTLSCKFKQTNIANHPRKETYQNGKIIMDKSKEGHYKIRIDFLNFPQKILLIDGNLAIFDLNKDKIVSKANLSSTPISYVFLNQLDIKRQFKSISLWEIPGQKMIFVKLKERKKQSSNIILYFKLYENRNVYHLMGWTLCDPHKNLTEVSFDSGSLSVNDPKIVKDPKIFDLSDFCKSKANQASTNE